MLVTLITVVVCVAQNLVPEAAEWLVGMETTAAILALGLFTVIAFRVRSVRTGRTPGGRVPIDDLL